MRRVLNRPLGSKSLFVLTLLLVVTVSLSTVFGANTDNKVVRQVAQKWMQVGTEQYDRGLYKAAEQSLLHAVDYQDYLSTAEKDKLNKLMDKTHNAVVQRDKILQGLASADRLTKQNKLADAKNTLVGISSSEFLTKDETKLIGEKLMAIDNQLAAAPAVKMPEMKAIAKTAAIVTTEPKPPVAVVIEQKEEDTNLSAIEDKLAGTGEKLAAPQMIEQTQAAAEPVSDVRTAEVQGSYIDTVNRKRALVHSHTAAVVNDAKAKAQAYLNKGDYAGAKDAVVAAQYVISENEMQLGESAYNNFNGQVKQITDSITQREIEDNNRAEAQRRVETIQAQQVYRDRMDVDRSNRVNELMNNALAYQKQQRYEDALGQLETLLAIDPQNNQALILKQTLEDMINFRKQLEVQQETEKQRNATLINADESSIPYADELTYPKNWREIIANRTPDTAIGQDPASAEVYKQLEKVVDLGKLSPEMSFGEAIDILRNSVDPPLKVFVSWRDLYDNADIDRTTPINMDALQSVSLGKALELMLKSVSGGFVKLGYTVEDGIIRIATAEELGSKLETLVYDVGDLLGRPADFYAKSESDVSADVETAGARGFIQETRDRDQLIEEDIERAQALLTLIQETVDPTTWYDAGGEGTIKIHGAKKLIIHQTREVHQKIEMLLKDMRKALGQQVAIEARFLVVGENFLEDIGLDVDAYDKKYIGTARNPDGFTDSKGNLLYDSKGNLITEQKTPLSTDIVGNKVAMSQQHNNQTILADTGITGSWPSVLLSPGSEGGITPGAALSFGTTILDHLQVDFLLRATQAHRDAKSLTAPKVTVLSGESASMRVQKVTFYPADYEFNIEALGDAGDQVWTVEYEDRSYVTGSSLNITPIITQDKKNVLLNIEAELREFLGFQTYTVTGPTAGGTQANSTISYPDTEISKIQTRVLVPDSGTLLLGGQKLTADVELESGVPILSKIPIIGRFFSNRSKVKDEKILLILVKPTIILQEETEARALAGN